MAYSSTTKLGLQKAVPNTNQAFETSVFNDNWDAVDAEAVAVDARLDLIEAADWVTSSRIAANAVGASEIAAGAVGESELASGVVSTAKIANGAVDTTKLAAGAVGPSQLWDTLDLRFKSVSVSTASGGSGVAVANVDFVNGVMDTALASSIPGVADSRTINELDNRGAPAKFGFFTFTGTTGTTGLLTVSLSAQNFVAVPVVTVSIVAPSATAGNPFHVGLNAAPSASSVVLKVQDHAGAVCNAKSVTVHIIAMASA
jgi:hypothetical protein